MIFFLLKEKKWGKHFLFKKNGRADQEFVRDRNKFTKGKNQGRVVGTVDFARQQGMIMWNFSFENRHS